MGMALDRSRSIAAEPEEDEESSESSPGSNTFRGKRDWHPSMAVSSNGGISATFRVSGLITIPSDGAFHSVTITQLKLDASMSWVTVPKVDTKAHLKVCSPFFIKSEF